MDIVGYINTQEPVLSWTTEQKQDFLNDLAEGFGYSDQIFGLQNPPTKKDFVNAALKRIIKSKVNEYRRRQEEATVTYTKVDLD